MKITLVKPPLDKDFLYGKLKGVGNYQQPLGIAYLAAYLRENGYEVEIIDSLAEELTEEKAISRIRGDIVGITATTVEMNSAVSLANRIKEEIDIPVILGGAHVTALPQETILNKSFDIGIVGEGEITLLQLVRYLESGKNFRKVKGIAYLDRSKVILTQKRELITDLDSLPFPARDLLPPLYMYKPTPISCKKTPLGSLITSRGCPYQCIYCDRAIFGNRFRARSPRNIVDEIEELITKYKAKELRFWDDVMNLDNDRMVGICKEIINRGIDIEWTCICRVNNTTKEQLYWMKKAGCWQISFGIESGNNYILKRIKKDLTTHLVRRTIDLTRKSGIKVRGFFMLGLPGENEKTMLDTIKFAKSLSLESANFSMTTLYPNTGLWEEFDMGMNSWEQFKQNDPYNMIFVPKGITKEVLEKYYRKAYKEFYLRPGYILKKISGLRNPREIIWHYEALKSLIKI